MRQGDWNVHPFGCDGVTIRNVTIFSPRWRGNTDGLDPDFCINVLVEDSVITSGDDAIAVKAGSGTPGGAPQTFSDCLNCSTRQELKGKRMRLSSFRCLKRGNSPASVTPVSETLFAQATRTMRTHSSGGSATARRTCYSSV